MRTFAFLLILLSLLLSLAAAGPVAADRTLTVFGAASLTEFLGETKTIFERAHPDVTLRLNLASSSRCRIQIEQGAPADVFLSANTNNMTPLVEANLAESPTIFAHNRLVIITPGNNPADLRTPADLAKPGIVLITCAPQVPIGRYTRTVIDNMDCSGDYGPDFAQRVLANVRSEEPTVKGIVAKVHLGEADAGICYASDVTPAVRPDVRVIDIPDTVNVIADYPIAVLRNTRQRPLAREFVQFIMSPQGQQLLAHHGFIPVQPPAERLGLEPS
ncbi:MAG: molybdate ABC transporter substrate-binding protein [Proteobacteria bacterium]|nr:molybdate ABC transporter substrate-binding protein [Pseudomonadota bacterium]